MKAYTLLLSCSLAIGMFSLVGCTDPGLCKRGEPGCACKEDNTCADGVCPSDGMCPKGDGGTGGTSGTGGTGGTSGTGGTEEIGCRPVWGTVCSAASTVGEACVWACEMFCQSQQQYCDEACQAGFCDPDNGPGVTICKVQDEAAASLAQARSWCNTFESSSCEETACTSGSPDCGEVCFEDCGSHVARDGNGDPVDVPEGVWSDDNSCDDGGPDADYDVCLWGGDCLDCGPRPGPAPACTDIGGCCGHDVKCCGSEEGLSHCLGRNGARCRADCTDSACPTGFDCLEITGDGDDDPSTPDAPTGEFGCVPK